VVEAALAETTAVARGTSSTNAAGADAVEASTTGVGGDRVTSAWGDATGVGPVRTYAAGGAVAVVPAVAMVTLVDAGVAGVVVGLAARGVASGEVDAAGAWLTGATVPSA